MSTSARVAAARRMKESDARIQAGTMQRTPAHTLANERVWAHERARVYARAGTGTCRMHIAYPAP
eukprot:2098018-Pleurochrysis_carterae.AAC.1